MIVIVDYKLGNLGSIQNMLKRIGATSCISSDPTTIEQADKLILPGVGSFDGGMKAIEQSGLKPVLEQRVRSDQVPTLGVCLGMQLMTRGSEEGSMPGLGWVDADTLAFAKPSPDSPLKIPHMGWNSIKISAADPLFEKLDPSRFYFVHSYHVKCDRPDSVLATTEHGEQFVSVYRFGNIWGTQFHPEKSHRFGKQLLTNFAEMN